LTQGRRTHETWNYILIRSRVGRGTDVADRFASTVQAKKQPVFSADTGIITLGPQQVLRIVTDNKDPDSEYTVTFKQMLYRGIPSGGGSRHNLVSQTTSDTVTVAPGEGFSIDIGTSESLTLVRAVVAANNEGVQVTGQIIDTTTGNIIAILIGL
jgi:hypothetical protein